MEMFKYRSIADTLKYNMIPNSFAQTPKMPTRMKLNVPTFDTAKQLGISQSFPNLASTPMGPTPSTPQFASTDLKSLGTLTTGYNGSTRYEGTHPGIDIANKIGTPIPAYSGGKVIESVTGKKQGDKGYGNYILVQDAQGNKWRYSHLYQNYVKSGTVLKPGQILGTMGNSGSTYSNSGGTGSHLDLRIRDAYNNYINPLKFFRNA